MCRTGCPTPGAHESWGECLRAAAVQVGPPDTASRRKWDAGLAEYAAVRKQGLQPQKPTWDSVERAKREAEA